MYIHEERNIEVVDSTDVFVLGGGIAGVSAALAAARQGKKVILCERSFCLGGLATSGLVVIYLPICDGYGHQVSFDIAEELLKLSVEIDPVKNRGYYPWIANKDIPKTEKDYRYETEFTPSLYAILLERLLLDAGVEILYGTYATSCSVKDHKIEAVIIENKSGRQAIKANSFVDASGDSDLALFSGAPTRLFNQGNILAAWYMSSDPSGYNLHMLGFCDVSEEEKKKGVEAPKTLVNKRFGGIDGKEISEQTILSHNSTYNDFLKKHEKDEKFHMATIATIPQLRMTRQIVGEYEMQTSEMHTYIEDSIGMVSDWRKKGPVYEVPFRSLYSKEIKNLICCGRTTCCTDDMWEIMRVIPCCAVTGEAAGIAAAISDDFEALDINVLQSKLKEKGVVLHEKDL